MHIRTWALAGCVPRCGDRARCLAGYIQRQARCSVVCCVNQLASVYWPSKMFGTTVFIMVLVLGPQLHMFCSQVFQFAKAREKVFSKVKRWFFCFRLSRVFVERLYFPFLTWFWEKRNLFLVIRHFGEMRLQTSDIGMYEKKKEIDTKTSHRRVKQGVSLNYSSPSWPQAGEALTLSRIQMWWSPGCWWWRQWAPAPPPPLQTRPPSGESR